MIAQFRHVRRRIASACAAFIGERMVFAIAKLAMIKRRSFEHLVNRKNFYTKRQGAYEQPVEEPQLSHFRQVPERTRVNWPQSGQASPS